MSGQDQFGPYHVIAPLSHKGFSVSHAVEVSVRPRIDRLAALTLIRTELSAQDAFSASLLESVQQTELLNHPTITRIFDYGQRDDQHYLLSEFVAGTSLQTLLNHPGLTDEVAVYIVSQLAIAVAHAHTRRNDDKEKVEVLHGDIRPVHVTIASNGAIKLGGYAIGSARAVLDVDPVSDAHQSSDLYAYTEPARARDEALSVQSDIFSLGALLWSLLAGRPLFEGADAQETKNAAKAGEIPDLGSIRADIPEALSSIVMSALGETPGGAKPIASAQSLRSALSAWLRTEKIQMGRPQLKDAFADTFDTGDAFGKSRPMTQREFSAKDPFSLIHTPDGDVEDPGVTVDIAALWNADTAHSAPAPKARPKPAAAPAVKAKPTPAPAPESTPAPTPDVTSETDAETSNLRHTTIVSPVNVDEPDDISPAPPAAPAAPLDDDQTVTYAELDDEEAEEMLLDIDDDQTVEYSQLDDEEAEEMLLDIDDDLISEAPAEDDVMAAPVISKQPSAPQPPSAPAPPSAPQPKQPLPAPPQTSAESKPGLASVLAASRASKALRGGRDARDTGSPIEAPQRTPQHTPAEPVEPLKPASPTAEAPAPKVAKKGSIGIDDIGTSDAPLFGSTPTDKAVTDTAPPKTSATSTPLPSTARPVEKTPEPIASVAPSYSDAPAHTDAVVPEPTTPASDDDATQEAPAPRDTPRQDTQTKDAKEKTYDFDPNAIYDEETEVVDYTGDTDEEYDDGLPPKKKRGIMVPILAVIVIGLIGYIAYTTFFDDTATVAEVRPAALRVESTPGRAHIFLDGEDSGERTPHTFTDLAPDSRVSVHVSLPGYEVADAVGTDLESGTTQTQQFELNSLKHTINLSTTPEGATVYIDGDEHGVTPTIVGPIEANPTLGVNIHVKLDGYRPRAIQHTWVGDERTSEVNIALEKR